MVAVTSDQSNGPSTGHQTHSKQKLAVVIPCYQVKEHILQTLSGIPDLIDLIICVDDACPEGSGSLVERTATDPRIQVLRHDHNMGVGGAMVTGYRRALEVGAQIVIKMDGDGQMDPALLPRIVQPILERQADYVKGNRFFVLEDLAQMPRHRVIGNAILSFMSKFSSGYWQVFDPTNGYTAIHHTALSLIPLHKLHRGYFFESDLLFRLSTIRGVVTDMPHRALYGSERSGISLLAAVPTFALKHLRNFLTRIFYNYYLRDFQLASLEWLLGPVLILFGLIFGTYQWIDHIQQQIEASAGTVMLSGLPLIVGLQMLLSAIGFDVDNQPRIPLQVRLDQATVSAQ